MEIYFK